MLVYRKQIIYIPLGNIIFEKDQAHIPSYTRQQRKPLTPSNNSRQTQHTRHTTHGIHNSAPSILRKLSGDGTGVGECHSAEGKHDYGGGECRDAVGEEDEWEGHHYAPSLKNQTK